MTYGSPATPEPAPLGVLFHGCFDLQGVLVLKKRVEHSSKARRAGRIAPFSGVRARASSQENYFYA
jgi:hypothetical protein